LYYSRQNDCLRQELESLWNQQPILNNDNNSGTRNVPNGGFLFPRSFVWAEEAFGVPEPDEVNLWMGDERAVSSMHKDHYENLFYVLQGEKVFTLCPPSDAPFLYEQPVPSGQFCQRRHTGSVNHPNISEWAVRMDERDTETNKVGSENSTNEPHVQWIAADVLHPDLVQFPLLQYAHPIPQVRVQAGEMLYLPSLWFHRVTQTCETVGINWWYDMKFDSPLWCYFHFLQQMKPTNIPSD